MVLAGEEVSMFLQRPLAQTLSHPKGGKWMNEGSVQILTTAPISVLGASPALTPAPGHVLACSKAAGLVGGERSNGIILCVSPSAWLSLGLSWPENATQDGYRDNVCCWTATVTGVS